MAKIFLSFSSHIFSDYEFQIGCFYEGLIRSLAEYGNEVLAINAADFLVKSWNGINKTHMFVNDKKLTNKIEKFNPDIAIIFNYSVPEKIIKKLECPVFIWGADAIQYFNEKEELKQKLDQYYFLFFTDNGVKGAIDFGVPKNRVFKVPAATGIKAEPIKQDKNVSFIGSNFTNSSDLKTLLKKKDITKVREVANDFRQGFFANHDNILTKHDAIDFKDIINPIELASLGTSQDRISILNLLTDLGLTIYGESDWYSVSEYLPWLSMSYNPQSVYSLQHNQDIYNASKVCINISHSQTLGGMPWRVMDILASNGCLVSDKKGGVADFTKGYVDIPLYESSMEAYELSRKLLKDEAWREEIVKGSQACIAAKGRWKHRLADMQDIMQISLENSPEKQKEEPPQPVTVLSSSDYTSSQHKVIRFITQIMIFIVPRRFYSLCWRLCIKLGVNIDYRSVFMTKKGKNKNLYEILFSYMKTWKV